MEQDGYASDSRLIFYRLERLEEAERVAAKARAAEEAIHRDREDKLKKDLDVAHDRIREFKGRERIALIKVWAASACTAFLAMIVIEFVKAMLHR